MQTVRRVLLQTGAAQWLQKLGKAALLTDAFVFVSADVDLTCAEPA